MKNLSIRIACGAILGIITLGATPPQPVTNGGPALVMNWGQDNLICVVFGDFFAIGRLTTVANDGGQTLFSCNGSIIGPGPDQTERGELTCGPYGSGTYVLTKSGQFNGHCTVEAP